MSIFRKFKYKSENDLFFSEVVGQGVYFLNEETMYLPDNLYTDTPRAFPVFENYQTGEQFFAKKIRPFAHNRAYVRYARTMVDPELILWPCDVIELNRPDGSEVNCGLEKYYDAFEEPELTDVVWKAVLFPRNGCIPGRRVSDIVQGYVDSRQLNYKNPNVVLLARRILEAFYKLNKKGYLYLEVSFDRFHMIENGNIYFDFSNLVYRTADTTNIDRMNENKLAEKWFPVEFAEPAVIQGKWNYADQRTQNYSLSAMLFYLLFGLHPYDGRLMDDYETNSRLQYYEKYEDYHKMPIFVFDPEDGRNRLGIFLSEKKILELWDSAPEKLKNMFQRSLAEDNAERNTAKDMNPTPEEWLNCFAEVHW